MAGRMYGGRRRGGRRGSSAGRGNNSKSNEKKKKTIEDYVFYVGSAKQASDCTTTTEYIINHIKKEYDNGLDVANALDELNTPDMDKWKPTMEVSTKTGAEKAAEDRQLEIEFKELFNEYRRRVKTCEGNTIKAYGLLWERCSLGMKNKLLERKDFGTKIKNQPIELLKAIKEHAHNYQESRYDVSIVLDALRGMFDLKQKPEERLTDYTRRFRTAREVMESHIGGPIVLEKVCRQDGNYQKTFAEDTKKKFHNAVFDRMMAYMYLENADQDKYGSILKGLNTQNSLGNC